MTEKEQIAVVIREQILDAEQILVRMPQIEITPKHHFIPGAYIREIVMPKDVMVIGKTHLTEHLSIMLTGEMSIVTDEGIKTIKAPYVHVGQPGAKRMGYTHEESRWITIHKTDKVDLDEIEKEQFVEDEICILDFKTGKVKPECQLIIDNHTKLSIQKESTAWQG